MSPCPQCDIKNVPCPDHVETILQELSARFPGRSVVSAQLATSPASPGIESAWIIR